MASNHTRLQKRGAQVDLSSTTTDAPIIPIEQIAKLQEIEPTRVAWVFEQTEIESNFRRSENKRVNTMIFAERALNLLFALIVAGGCISASVYLAISGHDVPASIIGGTTVVGLVAAFIAGRSAKTNGK